MDVDRSLHDLQRSAAAEASALAALARLLREELLLGAASLVAAALWGLLALVTTVGCVLLLVASSVATALWLDLAWPWALLTGALSAAVLAAACAGLARRRVAEADLSATRRQCAALLASLAGRTP